MSNLAYELREAGAGVWSRIAAWTGQARRITAGPAFVRVLGALSAIAGLALAVPAEVAGSPRFLVAAPVALGVALFPRTRWITVVLLLTVFAWLVTSIAFEDGPVSIGRVAAIGLSLYLTHACATLAAVLPYDSVVSPGLLARWALRTGAVLALSLGFGAGAMAVLDQLRPVQSVVGPIVGSVIAAGLAGLLAWHLRRRA